MADDITRTAVIEIDADDAKAKQKFDALKNAFNKPLKLEIDANVKDIQSKLQGVEKTLNKITGTKDQPKIPLAIEGIDKVTSQLEALKNSLNSIMSSMKISNVQPLDIIQDQLKNTIEQIRAFEKVSKNMEKTIQGDLDKFQSGKFSFNQLLTGKLDVNDANVRTINNLSDAIHGFVDAGKDLSQIKVGDNSVLQLLERLQNSKYAEKFNDIDIKNLKSLEQLQQLRRELSRDQAIAQSREKGFSVGFNEDQIKSITAAITGLNAAIQDGSGGVKKLGFDQSQIEQITSSFSELKSIIQQIHDLLNSLDIPRIDGVLNKVNEATTKTRTQQTVVSHTNEKTGTQVTTTSIEGTSKVASTLSSSLTEAGTSAGNVGTQIQAAMNTANESMNATVNNIDTLKTAISNLSSTIAAISSSLNGFDPDKFARTSTEIQDQITLNEKLVESYNNLSEAKTKAIIEQTQTHQAEVSSSMADTVNGFSEQIQGIGTLANAQNESLNQLASSIQKVVEQLSKLSDALAKISMSESSASTYTQSPLESVDQLSTSYIQVQEAIVNAQNAALAFSQSFTVPDSQPVSSLATALREVGEALTEISGNQSTFQPTVDALQGLMKNAQNFEQLAIILSASKEQIEAASKATQERTFTDNQAKKYQELTESVNKYKAAVLDLANGKGNVSNDLIADYKKEYLAAREEISKLGLFDKAQDEAALKPLAGLDEQVQKIKDNIAATKELGEARKALSSADTLLVSANAQDQSLATYFDDVKTKAEELRSIIQEIESGSSSAVGRNLSQISSDLSKSVNKTKADVSSVIKQRNAAEKENARIEKASAKALQKTNVNDILSATKAFVSENSQTTFQPMQEQLTLVNEKIKETETLLNSLNLKNLSDVDISNITAKAEELRQILTDSQSTAFLPASEEQRSQELNGINQWMTENIKAADEYKQKLEAVRTSIEQAQTQMQLETAAHESSVVQREYKREEGTRLREQSEKYKELSEAIKEYIKATLDSTEKIANGKRTSVDFDRIKQLREAYKKLNEEIKNNEKIYDKTKFKETNAPLTTLGQDIQKIRDQVQATKDLADARRTLQNTDKTLKGLSYKEGTKEYAAYDEARKKVEELRSALANLRTDSPTEGIRIISDETLQALKNAKQEVQNINKQGREKLSEIGVTQALNRATSFIGKNNGTQFEPMQAELEVVRAKAEEVRNTLANLDVNNASKEELDALKDSVVSLNAELNNAQSTKFMPPDMNQLQRTLANFESFVNGNPLTAEKYANEIEHLRQVFSKIRTQFDLDSVTAQFDNFKAQALEAGNVGETFASKLAKSFSGLGRYLATYVSFYRVIGVIKDAIGTVRELDTAFKDIRMVTSESMNTIANYQKESFKMADQIGSNALDLQRSTAAWIRLGYDFNEAAEASKASSWLVNVSEFDNIDDATTALVSMKAAYDELDFTTILDKLNAVGDSFSSSTDQLAQGLQNAAAVLKLQGNDIDQALALLTAGNDVTQDISKTSAGVRTIALRIAGLLPENMATY